MRNRTIKTLSILGCFLAAALCGSKVNAGILYSSPLTAPPLSAGNLVGQDGWTAHSGPGAKPIQVSAAGTTLVQSAGSGEDVNVPFTAIGTGQTYYFGFDVVVTGGSTTVYFAHFKDSGTSAFANRVFIAPPTAGGDFTFGIGTGSSPSSTWASDFAFGSTNRIVGSYTEGTNDIKLWVNPVSSASTSLSATASATAVSSFALRQSTGDSSQLISCLTVADTFGEALTCIPEPASIALMLGCLGLLAIRRK